MNHFFVHYVTGMIVVVGVVVFVSFFAVAIVVVAV